MIILFLLAIFLSFNYSFAQENTGKDYISFYWDNDMYFNSDKYYTNGFYLGLTSDILEIGKLDKLISGFENPNSEYSLSLVQEIFTPSDFSVKSFNRYDRPFAGTLLLNYTVYSYWEQYGLIIGNSLGIGLVGKNSYAEQVQNGLHSLLPETGDVVGWEYQIKDEFLLNYTINAKKGLFNFSNLDINLVGKISIGSPETSANIGMKLLYCDNCNIFSGGYSSTKQFSYKIFSKFEISYLYYDLRLQGGFRESIHTLGDINNIVVFNNSGLSLQWPGIRWNIDYFFASSRATGLKAHSWGRIGFDLKI